MLFTLSAIGFGLSVIEWCGYGPQLESFLDRVRVKSMQITLRNGEVHPKLTDLYGKVLGWSAVIFLGMSVVITVLLVPLLLILGQDRVSDIIGSGGVAGVMGVAVFGPLAIFAGLVAAYLIWCTVVGMLADVLNRLHRFSKGMVGTIGVIIGAICFIAEVVK